MTPPDNQMPERKPSLYQMTTQPERKGSGGLIAAILLLILAGAGTAYYFNQQKKNVLTTKALPAASTPTPQTPAPVAATPTGYNDVTKQSYIDKADQAFLAVQQPKKQAFSESFAAFQTAGGASSRGLTAKDSVTARRDLIAKCLTANDDYAGFVTGQEEFYKTELGKTPLTPSDVQEVFAGYTEKAKTATVVKLRQTQHDSLKTADDIMSLLEKSYGNWSSAAAGRLTFKRPADEASYRTLSQKYTTEVTQLNQLNSELKGTLASGDGLAPSGSDSPSTSPAASSASPATSSAPAAPPAAASPAAPR